MPSSPFLGSRYLDALTRPARLVWPELWDRLGAQAEDILSTGRPFRLEEQPFLLERDGRLEETWQTIAGVPILEAGGLGGLFGTITEDTTRARRGDA